MAKKDIFDRFLEQNTGPGINIAEPIGGGRESSYEERRRAAAGDPGGQPSPAAPADGAGESRRGPGRPRRDDEEKVSMNFLIGRDLKRELLELRAELYRSSVTDLLMEAIRDLLVKYGRI